MWNISTLPSYFFPQTPWSQTRTLTERNVCVNMNFFRLSKKAVFVYSDKFIVFNRHYPLIGWTLHCHVQHCCREGVFFRTFHAGRGSKGDKNKAPSCIVVLRVRLPPRRAAPCRSSSFIPQWIHEWMNLSQSPFYHLGGCLSLWWTPRCEHPDGRRVTKEDSGMFGVVN